MCLVPVSRSVLVLSKPSDVIDLVPSHLVFVADDFGYICLDKGKRELVNVVEIPKHNAETSHVQRPKQ